VDTRWRLGAHLALEWLFVWRTEQWTEWKLWTKSSTLFKSGGTCDNNQIKLSKCCIVVTLWAPGLTLILFAQACIVTLLNIFVVINNHQFVPAPSPNTFFRWKFQSGPCDCLWQTCVMTSFCVLLCIYLCSFMYLFVLFYVFICVVLCINLCCFMYLVVLFCVFIFVDLCIYLCCSVYLFVSFYVFICVVLCIVLFYVLICVVLCIYLCCSMYLFVLLYVFICVVLCIYLCCFMY